MIITVFVLEGRPRRRPRRRGGGGAAAAAPAAERLTGS